MLWYCEPYIKRLVHTRASCAERMAFDDDFKRYASKTYEKKNRRYAPLEIDLYQRTCAGATGSNHNAKKTIVKLIVSFVSAKSDGVIRPEIKMYDT